MGNHPFNLALRFILEMVALASVAIWGWTQHQGLLRYALVIGLPLTFALIWGIFAVPGDPSRSGKTVIKTKGLIRLILELVLFGLAVLAFYTSELETYAFVFGILILLHYLISYDRMAWLIRQK